jgi:hypothetical protein
MRTNVALRVDGPETRRGAVVSESVGEGVLLPRCLCFVFLLSMASVVLALDGAGFAALVFLSSVFSSSLLS